MIAQENVCSIRWDVHTVEDDWWGAIALHDKDGEEIGYFMTDPVTTRPKAFDDALAVVEHAKEIIRVCHPQVKIKVQGPKS